MNEPKYDEDNVNLGYLKKVISNTEDNISKEYSDVSRHYASKPQPPYHKGDTWIDGNIVYTCINDREIGIYNDEDWVTESGAKEEAERKSKTFLTQPVNYNVGDMWILQSDTDHKAGKKGEILVAVNGRKYYEESDWINQLGYGTIRSINEVANNLNDALKQLKVNKEEGVVTIFYGSEAPSSMIKDDLWYATETVDNFIKENLYKYDGNGWNLVEDVLIAVAFEEANEARLVEDGKIQSFYSDTEPIGTIGVGDIWNNTENKKLYRYNGTNWSAVYDTNITEIKEDIEKITETTTQITTDLGSISQEVSAIETTVGTLGYKSEAMGVTEIHIENADNAEIIKLEIEGNKTYESNLYPGENIFPSESLQSNMEVM